MQHTDTQEAAIEQPPPNQARRRKYRPFSPPVLLSPGDLSLEIARLRHLPMDELRARYEELFGRPTASRSREWLWRKCAWKLQQTGKPGLSPVARKRIDEIIKICRLDQYAPKTRRPAAHPQDIDATKGNSVAATGANPAHRDLLPGQSHIHVYKGRKIIVHATQEGFLWEGRPYRSLSAIAKAVTGQHWNGRLFFGFKERPNRS